MGDYSEIIEVYDIKVGIYSKLNGMTVPIKFP